MSTTSFLGSLFRSLLTLAGTFLIGRTFHGHALLTTTWDVISGVLLTAASIIWSIRNNTATQDTLESMGRQILQGAGGLLVGDGVINSSQLASISAVVILMIPIVWSYLSRSKTAKIAKGQLSAQPTGKVTNGAPPSGPSPLSGSATKTLLLFLLIGIAVNSHAQSILKPLPPCKAPVRRTAGAMRPFASIIGAAGPLSVSRWQDFRLAGPGVMIALPDLSLRTWLIAPLN